MQVLANYLIDNHIINNDILLFILGALALGFAVWWILLKK